MNILRKNFVAYENDKSSLRLVLDYIFEMKKIPL